MSIFSKIKNIFSGKKEANLPEDSADDSPDDSKDYTDDYSKQKIVNAEKLNDYLVRVDALMYRFDSNKKILEASSEDIDEFFDLRARLEDIMAKARQIKGDVKEYPHNYFEEMELVFLTAERALTKLRPEEFRCAIDALEQGLMLGKVSITDFEKQFDVFIAFSIISQESLQAFSDEQTINKFKKLLTDGTLNEANKRLVNVNIASLKKRIGQLRNHIAEVRMNLTRMENDSEFDVSEIFTKRQQLDLKSQDSYEKMYADMAITDQYEQMHQVDQMEILDRMSTLLGDELSELAREEALVEEADKPVSITSKTANTYNANTASAVEAEESRITESDVEEKVKDTQEIYLVDVNAEIRNEDNNG